jgi:simple sugar transport system ATP-binding protein
MEISLQDVHKHYKSVRANDGVNLEIHEGSIHGILGENGAGKSTLMKILAGYVPRTSGTILLDKKPVEYEGPGEATGYGIGMLYQDPFDFPQLSVIENFMMGEGSGLLQQENLHRRQLNEWSDNLGFQLDPDALVQSLTVGERHQLEMVRLMALGVKVLILDEPTTGISNLQKKVLFKALRKLAEQKKTVLLVSHKLEDVEALCDRLTVLRLGKVVGDMESPFDTPKLLKWMFGTLPPPPPCADTEPGQVTLTLEAVSSQEGQASLRACSAEIRRGEVVGLAGLEGSGQGHFLRLGAGLIKPVKGSIRILQKTMTGRDHHEFKACGVTFLPTSRLEEGLIPGLDITGHYALKQRKGVVVQWVQARKQAEEGIDQFRIMGTPSIKVESLSGGNQQRLLLALMPTDPLLLMLEHPTRGLDLESVNWVWEHLMSYAASGTSIVFSSTELDEILQVADRVLVFFNGVVVKDVRTSDTSLDELGQAIAGKG